MSPWIEQAYNEGLKKGIEKFYPGYKAYESYAEQLEEKIEGLIAINAENEAKIDEMESTIAELEKSLKWHRIGLLGGIPLAVGAGIVGGLLIK